MNDRIPGRGPGGGNEDDDIAWLLLKLRGWVFMLVIFSGVIYLGYWVLRWSYLR